MANPRISLITAVRDGEPFLARAMDSILSQGYDNLEYIVIDGGSRDGSLETIQSRERHLAHWISEPDQGHGHALNKGFAQATGDILGWLNADDLLAPGSLKTIAEIFRQEPRIKWITGIPSDITGDDSLNARKNSPFNLCDFLEGRAFSIQQESTFWHRELWETCGGKLNESLSLAVDGELWTRFFKHQPLVQVDAVLGGFRRHGENRSEVGRATYVEEMKSALRNLRDASTWRQKLEAKLWRLRRRSTVRALREKNAGGQAIDLGSDSPLPRNGYLKASLDAGQLRLEHFAG